MEKMPPVSSSLSQGWARVKEQKLALIGLVALAIIILATVNHYKHFMSNHFLPITISGNTLGGILLVALVFFKIHHGQKRNERDDPLKKLQELADDGNAEAHYELACLYKSQNLTSKAIDSYAIAALCGHVGARKSLQKMSRIGSEYQGHIYHSLGMIYEKDFLKKKQESACQEALDYYCNAVVHYQDASSREALLWIVRHDQDYILHERDYFFIGSEVLKHETKDCIDWYLKGCKKYVEEKGQEQNDCLEYLISWVSGKRWPGTDRDCQEETQKQAGKALQELKEWLESNEGTLEVRPTLERVKEVWGKVSVAELLAEDEVPAQESIEQIKELAQKGDASAQYKLAGIYYVGFEGNLEENLSKAIELYRAAALSGHERAYQALNDISKDVSFGNHQLEAIYSLGVVHEEISLQKGSRKDADLACKYYHDASSRDHEPAKEAIFRIIANRQYLLIEYDYEMAAKYKQKEGKEAEAISLYAEGCKRFVENNEKGESYCLRALKELSKEEGGLQREAAQQALVDFEDWCDRRILDEELSDRTLLESLARRAEEQPSAEVYLEQGNVQEQENARSGAVDFYLKGSLRCAKKYGHAYNSTHPNPCLDKLIHLKESGCQESKAALAKFYICLEAIYLKGSCHPGGAAGCPHFLLEIANTYVMYGGETRVDGDDYGGASWRLGIAREYYERIHQNESDLLKEQALNGLHRVEELLPVVV